MKMCGREFALWSMYAFPRHGLKQLQNAQVANQTHRKGLLPPPHTKIILGGPGVVTSGVVSR